MIRYRRKPNFDNISAADLQWFMLVNNILDHGFKDVNPRPKYSDGTPAHTISLNQQIQRYDLSKKQFPICTYRPLAVKSAIREILWIYQDQSNSLDLLKNKYKISWWDEWESKDMPGTIGMRYGATIKNYDIMNKFLKDLKENPFGRRHIISLWQEKDFEDSDGLMPCAFLTMWNVRNVDGVYYLDMTLIQRSSDWITAGNLNQIQYVALMMMVANSCGYIPGVFVHFMQNVQIYDRHIDAAKEMLNRQEIYVKPGVYPSMVLNRPVGTDFYDFKDSDFQFIDYDIERIKKENPQVELDLGI